MIHLRNKRTILSGDNMENIKIRHTLKIYEKILFWFYKNIMPFRYWKFEENDAFMEGYVGIDGTLHIIEMEIKEEPIK
jgi:hypothetical protein